MAWAFCTEERLRGRMRNEIRFLGGGGGVVKWNVENRCCFLEGRGKGKLLYV